MRWTWDADKDAISIRKHGISFETAELVFSDPLSVTDNDPFQYKERFRTIGVAHGVIMVVVHTLPETDYEIRHDWHGRIISARRATRRERLRYEESQP